MSYVRLNGTGFAPAASVGTIHECLAGGACDQSFGYPVTADGTGAVVDAWTIVHREITVGGSAVVCDATPGVCSVQVGSFEFPIAFSMPREVVTVSPTSGLSDGALVTVTASNFEEGRWVLTTQCATPDGDAAHCWSTQAVIYAQTGPDGSVVRSGPVVRLLPTPDGTVDCAAQTCYLASEDIIDYQHRWITPIQLTATSATTATSAPPTTTTTTGAGSLAKTGAASGSVAAGGALAVLVGAALVAVARRRRARVT
jgi:LPXTG-motif cell wall-anchored protein